ncbi:MAG: hypothetical protein HFI03_14060 [Lachnospiraceae bacterium]|jgi:hypothetical protein|nr:hypothetical protein [Lachnospiraceae bacterium]
MKNQSEISENKENYRGGVKWYREKIVEMVNRIDNENYLLKIYSFVKVFFED